jgi:hypothetical protein
VAASPANTIEKIYKKILREGGKNIRIKTDTGQLIGSYSFRRY